MLDREIRIRFTLRQMFCRAWVPPVLVIAVFAVFAGAVFVNWQEVDGPSWAQALGSVGAILVAVWVAERAHQREDHAVLMENFRLSWLADCSAEQMHNALDELIKPNSGRISFDGSAAGIGRVEEAAEHFRSLMGQSLPHGLVRPVFNATAFAATLLGEVETARANGHHYGDTSMAAVFLSVRRRQRQFKVVWQEIYGEYARHAKAVGVPHTQRVFVQ